MNGITRFIRVILRKIMISIDQILSFAPATNHFRFNRCTSTHANKEGEGEGFVALAVRKRVKRYVGIRCNRLSG